MRRRTLRITPEQDTTIVASLVLDVDVSGASGCQSATSL
jgi:hypothetical protein